MQQPETLRTLTSVLLAILATGCIGSLGSSSNEDVGLDASSFDSAPSEDTPEINEDSDAPPSNSDPSEMDEGDDPDNDIDALGHCDYQPQPVGLIDTPVAEGVEDTLTVINTHDLSATSFSDNILTTATVDLGMQNSGTSLRLHVRNTSDEPLTLKDVIVEGQWGGELAAEPWQIRYEACREGGTGLCAQVQLGPEFQSSGVSRTEDDLYTFEGSGSWALVQIPLLSYLENGEILGKWVPPLGYCAEGLFPDRQDTFDFDINLRVVAVDDQMVERVSIAKPLSLQVCKGCRVVFPARFIRDDPQAPHGKTCDPGWEDILDLGPDEIYLYEQLFGTAEIDCRFCHFELELSLRGTTGELRAEYEMSKARICEPRPDDPLIE